MQHLKNITAGNPKTKEQYQLTKNFDVIWLWSEDGKNWYEELKNFQEDTIKILYDENNIIVAITKDASTLNPEGYSVVEVPDITANRRADDSGKWMFKDGAVVKRIYTADEQQQQAKSQKAKSQKAALLSEAESVIQPLERAVRLNMATDEERARLESWERYSVLVSRVDTANPEWPQKPE
ncbi:tail fiber assembly protein [Escherichia coli]|nr:tail fiber assembly protein [Escherichia coli]EKK2834949.1 tail fiber assembly protein [Escherichia coli O33]ELN6013689.1 tail fiber assembly protein [Escherichia coli]EMA1420478.1 tail fiber assembly protein [Escherichia coli]EMA1578830.1 tail fiber assembly protein [Escherichia coli]